MNEITTEPGFIAIAIVAGIAIVTGFLLGCITASIYYSDDFPDDYPDDYTGLN